MKQTKRLLMLTLLGLWVVFLPTLAKAVPIVKLEVLDPSILPGETFGINVIADGVVIPDELIAFGFDVDTPLSFTFNGATIWPGFLGNLDFSDDSTLFTDTEVAGSTLFGLSGDNVLLATLNFTPSVRGTFPVRIFSDPSDLNEGLTLFPALDKIDFDITVDVNVPEPGSMILLSLGLLGFVVNKCK